MACLKQQTNAYLQHCKFTQAKIYLKKYKFKSLQVDINVHIL